MICCPAFPGSDEAKAGMCTGCCLLHYDRRQIYALIQTRTLKPTNTSSRDQRAQQHAHYTITHRSQTAGTKL